MSFPRSLPPRSSAGSTRQAFEKPAQPVLGASDPGAAMGKKEGVEVFVQVAGKDFFQSLFHPFGIVPHQRVGNEAEVVALADDRVADAQNPSAAREKKSRFLRTEDPDGQSQDTAGEFVAVDKGVDFFSGGELVQTLPMTSDLESEGLFEGAAVSIVVAVGEKSVGRLRVGIKPGQTFLRHPRVDQGRGFGAGEETGMDFLADPFVKGRPVKNSREYLFHCGLQRFGHYGAFAATLSPPGKYSMPEHCRPALFLSEKNRPRRGSLHGDGWSS
jgi:hypothetical protein